MTLLAQGTVSKTLPVMDLFMQLCSAGASHASIDVSLDCTASGRLFALSHAKHELWSCDAQALLLASQPHFLATCYKLQLPNDLRKSALHVHRIAAHPRGQFVLIQASQVRDHALYAFRTV